MNCFNRICDCCKPQEETRLLEWIEDEQDVSQEDEQDVSQDHQLVPKVNGGQMSRRLFDVMMQHKVLISGLAFGVVIIVFLAINFGSDKAAQEELLLIFQQQLKFLMRAAKSWLKRHGKKSVFKQLPDSLRFMLQELVLPHCQLDQSDKFNFNFIEECYNKTLKF